MPLTDFDTISYEDETVRKVVNFGDFNASHIVDLPILAGRFVKNVRIQVAVAFNASTTLIAGEIGATSSFLAATMLDPTVLNAVKNSFHNGVEDQTSGVTVFVTNAEGKNFPNGGVLRLTANQAVTAGQLIVSITYDGYTPVARGMVDHQNPTYGKGDMETTAWAGAADQTVPPAIP